MAGQPAPSPSGAHSGRAKAPGSCRQVTQGHQRRASRRRGHLPLQVRARARCGAHRATGLPQRGALAPRGSRPPRGRIGQPGPGRSVEPLDRPAVGARRRSEATWPGWAAPRLARLLGPPRAFPRDACPTVAWRVGGPPPGAREAGGDCRRHAADAGLGGGCRVGPPLRRKLPPALALSMLPSVPHAPLRRTPDGR